MSHLFAVQPAIRRPSSLLWITGTAVAGAALLPVAYLLFRAAGLGAGALDILLRPQTLQVLLRSILLATTVTASACVVGVLLAWLTTRTDLPARRTWTVAACLPLAVPSYVGAFALISALGPRGLLQQLLEPLGVDRLPTLYGFPGAWLTLTLATYPYVFLLTRAALTGMDPALDDAARSLGKSPRAVFREITFPQLRPALRAGALLVALYTLSDFGAVSLMQYNAFTRAIYVQYIGSLNLGTPAVLALMLVALTGLIFALEGAGKRGEVYHSAGAGARKGRRLHPLGRWRGPVIALFAAVTGLGIGVPLVVILIWLAHGIRAGDALLPDPHLLWHSIEASSLAAGLAILAALPLVILIVRAPGRRTRNLERAAYLGHALPGIVIALALVFFSARYLPAMYQSLTLLIAAYLIRFLPHAIGGLRTSLLQLNPRIEEAARSLGKSSWQVMNDITLPLLRPGLLMGAAMVFLSGMKELPATLLLSPTGFETLATRIWSATEEAFYARAALPALILIAVSAGSVWILLTQEPEERAL